MAPTAVHAAPSDHLKKRRRRTRVILASAIAAAVAGSGVYITTADANVAEVDVPGRLQAEAFSAQSGSQTEGTSDADGGKNVGWLANGDWLRYDNVTVAGADLTARIAADNRAGGSIELHLGSQTGTLLATFPVASTGGWQKWTAVSAKAASVPSGKQTVVAVMKSAQASDFVNINWFTLGTSATSPAPEPSTTTTAPVPDPDPTKTTPTADPTTIAPTTTPPATGSGWIPVDEAQWKKDLATFEALKQDPVPANNVRVPEFQTNCEVSKRAPDDPIVFPNMPGASHQHVFFGPSKIDAFTTPDALTGMANNCDAPGDLSAYWVPELTKDGKPVEQPDFRVYYGSRLKDPSTVKIFPRGLRMVVGNAKLQEPTPKGKNGQFWCAGSAEIGRSADGNWPVCAKGGNLIFQLTFEDCWDGKHLDSPDHKSHMGGAVDGKCQGDYPVAIPNLSFMVSYDSLGGDGLKLASGLPSSMHGDFLMGWDENKLGPMVRNCINQKAKCGTTPTF
jgi:hypothetical protein